jgi:hypothetical protein
MGTIRILSQELEHHSRLRKKVRRQLCSKIREYKHLFDDDRWIRGKITGGYLGDLSDDRLIEYCKKIQHTEEECYGNES